jgi:pyruvyltransferase
LKEIFDLPLYGRDWLRYYNYISHLFWFKKNQGVNWTRGQNFGDYLSCIIIGKITQHKRFHRTRGSKRTSTKLLAVGSILHFAKNGDVIWGSGLNGKIDPARHQFNHLDVRMVRGPLTKQFLEAKSITVGNVFGDPGLLLPSLFPDFKWQPEAEKIIVLPNLNELEICKGKIPKKMHLVSPMGYWKKIVFKILTSELVLTSSLHGLVVADAFGVPVRFVLPIGGETLLKYQDYYLGTGRSLETPPTSSFADKITAESGIAMPKAVFNPESMLAAFPDDLFE